MLEILLNVLFVLIFTHTARCSLLSRFRYPNEYVAKEDSLGSLDDLDENTYRNLVKDLPQLRDLLREKTPWYRRNPNASHPNDDHDYEDDADERTLNDMVYDEVSNDTNANVTTSTRMPFATRWPLPEPSPGNGSYRRWWFDPYSGTQVATCYWCGLQDQYIPVSPQCYKSFESGDAQWAVLARYNRAYCYDNNRNGKAQRKKKWYYGGYVYTDSRGLISQYYGNFHGGCFKRYLDVGEVYTQRGCRYWWPLFSWHTYGTWSGGSGRSFAAHRYRMLEAVLKHEKDRCIMSPHASLTPFARGISLYVRYHVCVCSKRYCNAAQLHSSLYWLIFIFLIGVYLIL